MLLKRKKANLLFLFNKKAYQVNQLLAGKYGENGFNYIPHDNISTGLYFSRDGFHLKRKGIY